MDFQPIQSSHLTATQLGELIHQVSLNGLVFQEDVIQLAMWKEHVVSYDFSIAFSQEEEFYRLSDSLYRYSQCRLFYPEVALEMLRLPTWCLPVVEKVYYEGIRAVVEMDTSPLFEALDTYFPERIAGHYKACVIKMKERVREKLAEYDRRVSVPYL